jgi:hypothetical protein
MSDRDKGFNGSYVEDSYSNIQYQLGAQDARFQKEAEDRARYNGGYTGGGPRLSPAAATLLAKLFLFAIAAIFVFGVIDAARLAYYEKVAMNAATVKKEKAQAAMVAHQQKLLENRLPLHFNGYTLYSDTSQKSHFLSFHITNAAGKTIWVQPKWMDAKITSESKPSADVTAKYYLHPGQVQFIINGYGKPGTAGMYLYFVSINKQGHVSWASSYHTPYKKPWHYNNFVLKLPKVMPK